MFKNHHKVSFEFFFIQNDNLSISSNIWIFQAKISLIKLSNETFWVILKHCECLEERKKKISSFIKWSRLTNDKIGYAQRAWKSGSSANKKESPVP